MGVLLQQRIWLRFPLDTVQAVAVTPVKYLENSTSSPKPPKYIFGIHHIMKDKDIVYLSPLGDVWLSRSSFPPGPPHFFRLKFNGQ